MSKYIKLFNNHAQYEAFTASTEFKKPNVSACFVENEAHFNPGLGPYEGHDYVEIGGLKWATMNIGASSETDTGLYFQWGDVSGYTASQVGSGEGKKAFSFSDYKYLSGASTSSSAITKYNSTDGKTVLDASDDAAVTIWGGLWRMPTNVEFQSLKNAVNTAWTSDYQSSGVAGLVCTDKTDSSKVLFFPVVGLATNGNINSENIVGFYWSNTKVANTHTSAYDLYININSSSPSWSDTSARSNGCAIRAVAD